MSSEFGDGPFTVISGAGSIPTDTDGADKKLTALSTYGVEIFEEDGNIVSLSEEAILVYDFDGSTLRGRLVTSVTNANYFVLGLGIGDSSYDILGFYKNGFAWRPVDGYADEEDPMSISDINFELEEQNIVVTYYPQYTFEYVSIVGM